MSEKTHEKTSFTGSLIPNQLDFTWRKLNVWNSSSLKSSDTHRYLFDLELWIKSITILENLLIVFDISDEGVLGHLIKSGNHEAVNTIDGDLYVAFILSTKKELNILGLDLKASFFVSENKSIILS